MTWIIGVGVAVAANVTRRPGFVWNARIAMIPGVNVFVHDVVDVAPA